MSLYTVFHISLGIMLLISSRSLGAKKECSFMYAFMAGFGGGLNSLS